MNEYQQKIISVSKFEANQVINYLGDNYGLASAGIFDMKDTGKVKIESQGNKIEVVCNCDKKVINELEELIEQNE